MRPLRRRSRWYPSGHTRASRFTAAARLTPGMNSSDRNKGGKDGGRTFLPSGLEPFALWAAVRNRHSPVLSTRCFYRIYVSLQQYIPEHCLLFFERAAGVIEGLVSTSILEFMGFPYFGTIFQRSCNSNSSHSYFILLMVRPDVCWYLALRFGRAFQTLWYVAHYALSYFDQYIFWSAHTLFIPEYKRTGSSLITVQP